MAVRATGNAPHSPTVSGQSAEGYQIAVQITDTTIHTCDEQSHGKKLFISACNNHSSSLVLTINWLTSALPNESKVCMPPESGWVSIINSRTMPVSGTISAKTTSNDLIMIYAEIR